MRSSKKYINRFWSKVEKTENCWLWCAYINEKGYGYFYDGKNMVRVHRFAYEITVGAIPKDCEIDHTCRVRNCVNPDHLEAVSHRENCLRGVGVKTHCVRGHKFNVLNTWYNKLGHRKCRECWHVRRLAEALV